MSMKRSILPSSAADQLTFRPNNDDVDQITLNFDLIIVLFLTFMNYSFHFLIK